MNESDSLDRTEAIRRRFKEFCKPRKFTPLGRVVTFFTGLVFCALIVTFKSGLDLIRDSFKRQNPAVDDGFADRAVAVMGGFITGSQKLFRENNPAVASYPARYLLPGDGLDSGKPSLVDVASLILEPPPSLNESVQRKLAEIATDENFKPGVRRQVPTEICGGRRFFTIDVNLQVAYLPEKRIHDDMPFQLFLADYSENEQFKPIPYWIAFGDQPEPEWAHWATAA